MGVIMGERHSELCHGCQDWAMLGKNDWGMLNNNWHKGGYGNGKKSLSVMVTFFMRNKFSGGGKRFFTVSGVGNIQWELIVGWSVHSWNLYFSSHFPFREMFKEWWNYNLHFLQKK